MYFRRAPHVGAALFAAVSLIAAGRAAQAQSFNQFVGFGDSTVDSGWYFTHTHDLDPIAEGLYKKAQAAGGGVATTIGGQMNSTILASMFGLSAIPVGEPGGTNYAAGGASNITYANYSTLAPNTVSQIGSYLAAVNGAANLNALYLISSGGNDISGAICPGGVCAGNATQLAQTSAADLATAISQLHTAIEPEIAFAPAFSMPAVSFGRDWATATVGTTVKLGHGMTGYASFNSELGQGRRDLIRRSRSGLTWRSMRPPDWTLLRADVV